FDSHVHLASRRLSIIDLELGDQPMYDENRTLSIVYNGEVYNFKEIKKDLGARGHSFFTNTDTEVVLHAYMEWGEKCLSLFRGMFAFCIWDYAKKELFLARDRLGIKPLYYSTLADGTFLFSSEIKALMQYPGIEKRMYTKAMDNLLTYGFNIAPNTFFEGIKQLLPGHYMIVSANGVSDKEYWDIDLDAPLLDEDESAIAAQLEYVIGKAVGYGHIADVPVAAYLSGGIDSSAITGIYSRLSDRKIRTISIAFDHADYDEAEYSRQVSSFFDTENIEFTCTVEPEGIEDLIYYLEEPMVTLLNLPLFLLSGKVRESGFKVVLSGDGADEILGGYDYFKMLKVMRFISRQESSFRKNLLRRVMPNVKNFVQAEIQYMYLKNIPVKYPALPYRFQGFPFKAQMYSKEYNEELDDLPEDDPFFFGLDRITHRSLIDQALYIDTKMRLLNLTLPLADKMSMANSVELRPLFLDHDLVNFVFRIPDKYKIKVLSEKNILKQSMKGFLPDSICRRKKQPLQPPGKWFIDSAYDMIRASLSKQTVVKKGYFNPHFVEKALVGYDNQSKMDYSGVIIVAFFVHLWDEIFLQ
ncbi:MAG: asparagine synthase (glutamine-hydrolyzing), partial [Thermodesulfobacteriota bacterium]|nr:asparagine synthase (glutamine-hydrolyzing) [Thermodesulfobacteriota bacterium]